MSNHDMENERSRAETVTLRRRLEKTERLLLNLTPGGSEFHGSPERCAEWIRDRLAMTGKLAAERNEARHALENLLSIHNVANRRLEKAERLAEALQYYADPDNWDDGICLSEPTPSGVEYARHREYISEPDMGDIARAALAAWQSKEE